MARNATIFRARLALSDLDRDVYADRTLTIAQHPSETDQRMLMRLLAYGLCYEEDLEFGRGVSATDEPDLWSREGDGRVRQWVEVGQPDGKRLLKAARQSQSVSVLAFGEGVERWREAQIDAGNFPANLSVSRIDDGFVDALAQGLDRQIQWEMTVTDGVVYLTAGETPLETTPTVWLARQLA